MVIAIVGELVVGWGEFLKALSGYGREVARELGELGEYHCTTGNEAVNERFLTHFSSSSSSAELTHWVGATRVSDRERQEDDPQGFSLLFCKKEIYLSFLLCGEASCLFFFFFFKTG